MLHRILSLVLVVAVLLVACNSSVPSSVETLRSQATSTTISTTVPAEMPSVGTLTPIIPMDAQSASALEPGDKIGEMILRKGKSSDRSPNDFCPLNTYVQQGETTARPETTTMDCFSRVPNNIQGVVVGDGWAASDKDLRESNWRAITWELYIDGQPVDLPAFGTFDVDEQGKARIWNVALENLTPGDHSFRTVYRISQSIFDGSVTFPPGTYDTAYRFTVSSP